MHSSGTVLVKRGREKRLRNGYPWIQKSEILKADAEGKGEIVEVREASGDLIGIGTYNASTRFCVRMLGRDAEQVDEAFFANRFRRAIAARKAARIDSDAMRLVFSEADLLPGLIVDQFAESLVVQVRSRGMERLRNAWLPALIENVPCQGIYEKSDMAGRDDEGLAARSEVLYGEVPHELEIREADAKFIVPIREGLKTGFFLDQRRTRRHWREEIREGEKVLDAFCYTGSFSIMAAMRGGEVTAIDIHHHAVETAKKNAILNQVSVEFQEANAFEWLQAQDGSGSLFDRIMLDPPAIAKSSGKRDTLKWAIWKLVYHALPRLKPGGVLVVCNCSFQLSLAETIETCRFAAADRGIRLNLESITLQDVDHPAPLWFPEALYLKCVWLRREAD